MHPDRQASPLHSLIVRGGARECLAGAFAGCAGVLVGHPFDTVKVRLQTNTPVRYLGAVDCVIRTLRQEGVLAFMSGVHFPFYSKGLEQCVAFGVNASMKRHLTSVGVDPGSVHGKAVAGAASGAANAVVMTPVELIKIRLQVQASGGASSGGGARSPRLDGDAYRGPIDCTRRIVRGDGLFGLYRGFHASLCSNVAAFSVRFCTYDGILEALVQPGSRESQGPVPAWAAMLAGGTSGVVTWFAAFPLDTVKSELQARRDAVRLSLWSIVRNKLALEGWNGFFRGFGTAIARAFPTNAVIFLAYERAQEIIP